MADPCGRAVYGIVLRLLHCWDREFESRSEHIRSTPLDELSISSEESYHARARVCVCVYLCVT